jgi:hypothetical protein
MRNCFFKCVLLLGGVAVAGAVQGQSISIGQDPSSGNVQYQTPAVKQSQTTILAASPRQVAKKPKPLTREISGGFRLNTDGWSLFGERGSIRSEEGKNADMFNDVRIFQLEFSEHKHPKEIKQSPSDQSGGQARGLIYGKINNFYALKLGYGLRKMIAGKPEPNTVSIHWANTIGLAIGMEKPYYVDGFLRQDNGTAPVAATFKYSDETREDFTDLNYLTGSAGFTKGIGEIKVVPGLHFKSALHFDFAASRKTALAVETGFNVEYYSRPIVLMANQDSQSLFANLFASFQFGRRK